MVIKIIRAFFILACALMGTIWANEILERFSDPTAPTNLVLWRIIGGLSGTSIAVLLLISISFITQELFERLLPIFVAVTIAMLMGFGLSHYLRFLFGYEDPTIHVYLTSTLVLLFGFAGISLGLTKASGWESLLTAVKKRHIEYGNPKVVDTSVIIDGRICDICATGFVEGTLMIPRFVLKELQNIADSADVLRRAKGRRGLDIVKALQEDENVEVQVVEDDPKEVREVDGKLVVLAREYNAKILTNDFNLNKVAQIEGVKVLNINDLANALKPAVIPDEHMEVKIIKEGKEPEQGVGYLDDGTMIVVDGGRRHVGKSVSVVVTSVLQTAAGRMIFTKMDGVLS